MPTPEIDHSFTPADRRVLLVGWDGADWRVIRPLLEQGKMPVLRRFLDAGVSGNIATLHPVLSPMLWTSIATGKRPFKHGIHGFTEPAPDGKGVRPVTNLSRKTKAVWNILNQVGKTPIVVGWWPSSPAEPIRGAMVSNHFQRAPRHVQASLWPMRPGTVHPERLVEPLKEFRFHPRELVGEHILPFVPKLEEIDQEKDRRLQGLAGTIAETTSIHAAATALMQLEPWDFFAVYYDGVDHFSHGFMKYHPPRQEWIPERDFELYSGVIEAAYRFHDMMLGALLALAGEETTVILMSDHGFHPDHLRPRQIPAEPAGPAVEHRDFGILAMRGPGIRRGEPVHGASLLDICPTILSMYGLPIGEDMDGKPLVTAFEEAPEIDRVPSWDEIEGEDGTHPPDKREDPVESAEAMRQLVELGYVEEPSEDAETAVRECVRELRYNLAQSYCDANRYADAAALLEPLWRDWPEEHRFGGLLIQCYGALRELATRAEAIDRLEANIAEHREKAQRELKELEPHWRTLVEAEQHNEPSPEPVAGKADADDKAGNGPPPQQLRFQMRKLAHLAAPRTRLIQWLRATQALAEGRDEDAFAFIERLRAQDSSDPKFHLQLGGALLRLKRFEDARDSFANALEHDSENASAQLGIAEAATGLRDWSAVVDHALSAIELLYFNPRAHTLLGRALHETGDSESAEAALGVALSQAPSYARALRLMGRVLRTDPNRAHESREFFGRAREARARSGMERGRQRLLYQDAGALDDARHGSAPDEPFAHRPIDPHRTIVVVSGLPRSGTSMMMQMLSAGGLPVFTDAERAPDEDNPRGYLEHGRVKALASDASWIGEARGRVVKIVSPLLRHLPPEEDYRFIFMERDLSEVLASQRAMLERQDRQGADLDDERLANALIAERDGAMRRAAQAGWPLLRVRYADAVEDPPAAAQRVNAFLGGALEESTMATAIDARLRRQRRGRPDSQA